jgi:hypothetical protein
MASRGEAQVGRDVNERQIGLLADALWRLSLGGRGNTRVYGDSISALLLQAEVLVTPLCSVEILAFGVGKWR